MKESGPQLCIAFVFAMSEHFADQVTRKNILYVDMQYDQIKIRLPDGEHWIVIDKVDIPNACVFEELVHQVIG